MKRLSRLAYGCVALACALWAADRLSAQNLVRERALPRTLLDRGDFVCGTQSLRDLQLVRTRAGQPLPDGELLSFEQSPPLLTPDYTGDFGLRRVLVVGDFPNLQFRRADRDNPDHIETWPRTTTMAIGGRLISVFEMTWHDTDLTAALPRYLIGFDRPQLFWGTIIEPGASAVERSVVLRMSFSSVPESQVQRVNDRVQYASNVVNLVLPDFEDSRVANGLSEFNLVAASRLFYQYFPDQYESIAFVPKSSVLSDFSAFHTNVKNAVTGLGMTTFDSTALFGSGGTLQGIELFGAGYALVNASSTHEFAHQWGDDFDWAKIASISTSGHQPTAHSPLWWAGETLIGAVLTGDRRVTLSGDTFQIERTPAPIHYHPIELYSMGLIGRADVPEVRVFQNQGQFSASAVSRPEPGTAVQGESTLVRIDDIIREHGARSGPGVPATWRRATVIVSRDGLISQSEMNYWNFFAQRIGDRNHTGVPSVEGYGSAFMATDGRVSLSTAIVPLAGPVLPETLAIDDPPIGARDFRGIELSGPLPTHFRAGEVTRVSGHVTASDTVDFNQALIFFQPFEASNSDSTVRASGAVSRTGDFTLSVRFTDSQKGRYIVGIALFWPNSGSQYARTYLTPVMVD